MSKGRPALFRGAMAKAVAGLLKANGLKGGKEILAAMGAASLPTLQKLAAEHGVEFKRGRPASGSATVEKPKGKGKGKDKGKDKPGKKRGRPLGSKNKAKGEVAPVVTGKKRGRPLGSKNKAKGEVAPVVVETPVETPVEVAPVVVETPVETPVEVAPVVVETPEVISAPAPVASEAA